EGVIRWDGGRRGRGVSGRRSSNAVSAEMLWAFPGAYFFSLRFALTDFVLALTMMGKSKLDTFSSRDFTGVTGRCCCAAVAHQRAINLGSKGVKNQREASARCLTKRDEHGNSSLNALAESLLSASFLDPGFWK
ncbi:hypothetical protein ILYODFUR_020971, partial [Ilyodon furcidens]